MFLLLNTFWFIRTSKYVLFWVYLWQLKEYHIGRFLDHFNTHKGKKLIFDPLLFVKIILAALFILRSELFTLLFSILFLLYFAESLAFIASIALKRTKKPLWTAKTVLLTLLLFALLVLFAFWVSNPLYILLFDILTPLIVSLVVFSFQPLAVLVRNNTLNKAAEKIKNIKSAGNLKVIAITGSYGKTSTKEFLSTILSKKYKVLKTKEHQNSEIGISRCILDELNKEHQVFIAEVGAYNKGKVKEVCNILKPEIGVVTGVNEQHLALFGSLDNLLSAEGGRELAKMLPEDGVLVLNGDNKYCLDLYKKSDSPADERKKVYSTTGSKVNSDVWTDQLSVHEDFISFLAVDKSKKVVHFRVNVLGGQNIQNILAAILVAKELDMSLEEIAEACKNIKQEQAGMTLKKGKHGINIIDSSYSSNPDGVYADIDYLNVFSQKKVIVMPCLIELGEKSKEVHERIGKKISEICDLAIITSKDRFEDIKRGAAEAGMEEKNILFCENPNDIYSIITLFCKSGDAVLLEGRVPSRLLEMLIN